MTPIKPSGAVRNTIAVREKLRSCSISSVKMMNSITGTPAAIAPCPFDASSTAPATWIW